MAGGQCGCGDRAAYSASDCASAMQDQTAGGGRMASKHACLGEVLQQFNQNEIVEHTYM